MAWYALFANRPSRALAASERALALEPDTLWIDGDRAHALLFLGRTKMAIAAYAARKGEMRPDNLKWEEGILKDFVELRKHGLGLPALRRVEEALAAAPDSPEVLDQTARKLAQAGKYAEAVPLAEHYLKEMKSRYGEEHRKYAPALDHLASRYEEQGRYAEAEPLFKQALAISERFLGPEHIQTLASAQNLGGLYSRQGRYSEAEALYKRALQGEKRVMGPDNEGTLTVAVNLALLYTRAGRYAEAEPLNKRALEARERTLGKDHPSTLLSLNNLALLYMYQGQYGKAEPLFKQALESSERVLGKEHPFTLTCLGNLMTLYLRQGRYGEAEPLAKRALETSERTLGKEHPDTLLRVNNLAVLLNRQGRYAEAEPLYKRALEVSRRVLGGENPFTLARAENLAVIYTEQGRYAEALALLNGVIETQERVLGKEHPDTFATADSLAALLDNVGRYSEAEALYKRTIEIRERVLGKEHPDTHTSLNNLAVLYQQKSDFARAEVLMRSALELAERVFGKEHPKTLTSLNNLASIYDDQERYQEAEALYRRVLETSERVLGKEHPDTLIAMNNLAAAYMAEKRYEEAEPLFLHSLEARVRLFGKDHPGTLLTVGNLATLREEQGRYAEAEPLQKEFLETATRVFGPDHPHTLTAAQHLGNLYRVWNRYGEAGPYYRRALEGRERIFGPSHPYTLMSRQALAGLAFDQGDFARAVDYGRRSTADVAQLTLRANEGVRVSGGKKSEAEKQSEWFWRLVKAAYRMTPEGTPPDAALTAEMFETAQWALSSEAAQSLSQMAARGAASNPELAALARERQDLVLEWRKLDALRDAALAKPADKRDAQGEAENMARLAAIDARLAEIDTKLKAEFPDFAALASPAQLPLTEAQGLLGENEALVLFLDTPEKKPTPEETFIWVVTKTGAHWLRSELGKAALAREVEALRCGLDAAAWSGPSCAELTGQQYTKADASAGKPLPFDPACAHRLYKALFGQVEDLIKGKQLLIVPSGPLTQLPFQVLVTAPPPSSDLKSAGWLIHDHALTILPAVSSLKALRRVARPSAAKKPMIGFGNPLLDGDKKDPREQERAQRARGFKTCADTAPQRVASNEESHRGVAPLVTRGGLASVSQIRYQVPLPETAKELCAVARDLNADAAGIYLGARATEREVKALSASGQLAQYRIVHFATHGALAGQVSGSNEPGLLLTPPDSPTEEDDGYFTASEIAALKLDADWVILSACNTAAGGAESAEALSGLARAFIYAQARALLVSHWEVNSAATVKLITGAMSRLAADKAMGRAEAMRQSMLAMIDKGTPQDAHPAFWAPFVVVGEGGAGR
ncbi:MAG: tetratricopeptide repeat protein [Rhodomicrobium sp.]